MDAKPPDAGRRERTKAENRDTILAAARQVFAQLGFAGASVRDIIRATPLASGTFYNYFKSREEVYLALRDEQALALRPRLRQARLAAASAESFVGENFRLFFRFAAEQGPSCGGFRMDSPQVLAGIAELEQDVAAAMAKGLLPVCDPALLAAAMTGIAFELAEQVKAGTKVETTASFATALVLRGLAALPKP